MNSSVIEQSVFAR